MASDTLAADERCAPEVFWLDTALRVSDYGVLGGRVFNAYEGPEALAKLLAGLDRSKLHVVQVRLGHPAVYMKPGFGARNYQTPLEYAYDNPKAANGPRRRCVRPRNGRRMYAQEHAALDWLVGTFFPANAGSRFVSIRQLRSQAESGLSEPVTRAELRKPPRHSRRRPRRRAASCRRSLRAGARYFSLADMFGLLITAIGDTTAPGAWPASSQALRLFGPLEIDETRQATGARIPIASLMRQSARLRDELAAGGLDASPTQFGAVVRDGRGTRLTAGQFLRAIAEAYVAPAGTSDVAAKWTSGTSLFAGTIPAHQGALRQGRRLDGEAGRHSVQELQRASSSNQGDVMRMNVPNPRGVPGLVHPGDGVRDRVAQVTTGGIAG